MSAVWEHQKIWMSNDINNDPWSMPLHLDLNVSQSNDINNDQRFCTWLWMLDNQMTLTMIYDSASGFECQPIKWHQQWSLIQHLALNANQSNGMTTYQWLCTWIWMSANQNDINNDQWLSTWLWMPTNQMAWTMIRDSASGFNCRPIKWH